MLEAWNVAQANFIQSTASSLQRTSTRRPFPGNGEGGGNGGGNRNGNRDPPAMRPTHTRTLIEALPEHLGEKHWQASRNGKQLCRLFQVNMCRRSPCPYLHECALEKCAKLHPVCECPTKP